MADSHGPFDNANMGEVGWQTIFSRLSGVLEEDHLVATASGVTSRGVDLTAGSVLHQGFHYTTDTTKEVVSVANASGLPRVDRCVARVDTTANTVLPVVIEGTPGSNPSPPAIADTDEPLWRWTVANGATTVSSIINERRFLSSVVQYGHSDDRPATGRKGQIYFSTDLGRWDGWNGSQWVVLHEDTGWIAVPPTQGHWIQPSTKPLQIRRIGKIVNLLGAWRRGPDFSFVATSSFETFGQIPVGFRPPFSAHGIANVANLAARQMQVLALVNGDLRLDLDGEALPKNEFVDINMTWMVD